MRSGSTDGQLNSGNREESSTTAVPRCHTYNDEGLTLKQCPSKAQLDGNRKTPRGAVKCTVLQLVAVNDFLVDDLLLDK